MRRDGGLIVDDVLSADQLPKIRAELAPISRLISRRRRPVETNSPATRRVASEPFLGFYSSPSAPGEGIEIAPPERIFGDRAGRYTRIGSADDLMEATTRGVRNARSDSSD